MFKYIIIAFVLLLSQAGYSTDLLEIARSDVKTQKKAILAENLNMTTEQSEKFWKIYTDYEYDMTKIGDNVVANIKDFADNYENLTDEKAEQILKQSFENQENSFSLLKKYTKKIAKEIDVKLAARFYQIESIIGTLIDLQIMSAIPLAE